MKTQSFLDLCRCRYSVRRYDPDRDVPGYVLTDMTEAARIAPSACNRQPWRIVIIRDPAQRQKICRAGLGGVVSNRFAEQAPILIVLAADLSLHYAGIGGKVKGIDYHQLDVAIAGEHMVLAAASHGVGTCWIGWFREKPLRKIVRLPRHFRALALLTVGYPAVNRDPAPPNRKSAAEIVRYDGWT